MNADMHKATDHLIAEIREQPHVIEHIVEMFATQSGIQFPNINLTDDDLAQFERIHIVACGTSYHAGLIAKSLIETWAKVPVEVEIASEFNYRDVLFVPNTLFFVITQSGTTADTILATEKILEHKFPVIAITNVVNVAIPNMATGYIHTDAGPEVSVAATKSFTSQLLTLILFALKFAVVKGEMIKEECADHIADLRKLPQAVEKTIESSFEAVRAPAQAIKDATSALYMGREKMAALAREGALKLKETSYLHAEAYAAGEIKHGPLALIQEDFPIVAIVLDDATKDKSVSNIKEYHEAGAIVTAIVSEGDDQTAQYAQFVLPVPRVPEFLAPVVAVVPMQLLARAVSEARGNNIDEPRNLSKSVTSE